MPTSLTPREIKLSNTVIVAITLATIGASLYLAAIDRLLLVAAVCLVGAIPVTLLVVLLSTKSPPADKALRWKRRRDSALWIASAGLIATVAGALVLLSPYTSLATLLLFTGPGLALGGLSALQFLRRDRPQS